MLEGVRVLDLSCFFSGPFCGYLLAQMGAEVIKIEEPRAGDPSRRLGLDPALSEKQMGAAFLAANAGKKSVTIDLKTDEGRAIFHRLLGESPIVLENFRPGVMRRLGIDYASLKALRPKLIYCAISGFGQTGPMSGLPAFDQIIQGLSGLMSITGTPDGGPQRVGYPVGDSMAGIFAALAICGAIVRRNRDGVGEMIDVAMLDAVMSSMGWAVSNYLIAGVVPKPMGNDNFTSSPSGTFAARDGSLNIAINTDDQYRRLALALGRPELLDDARFATRESRKTHRRAMNAAVEEALQARCVDEWIGVLAEAGIPAGHVLSVPQAFALPQLAHRDFLQRFEAPMADIGAFTIMRPGFTTEGGPLGVETPPSQLGADTQSVLEAAGFATAEIEAFRRNGTI